MAAATGLSAPVLDELRRLTGDGRVPEVAAGAPGGEEARLRMFDAVVELIRASARERVLFIALEDVHAADRSSLALLGHLLHAAPDARLLLVLTYRSAEVPADHPLATVLEALDRDRRLTRVTLHGLPEAAVARFLPPEADVAPAALRSLHERTAGNPFFLGELVRLRRRRGGGERSGDEPPAGRWSCSALVPDRVPRSWGAGWSRSSRPRARCSRSPASSGGRSPSPASRGSAGSAATPSPRRSSRRWRGGCGGPPGRAGPFGFAHAIVRDAVYDELSPTLRGRLHTSVAAVLQESRAAGGEATAAEAAHHALAAARCGAEPQAAWELSLDAAREAAALQAHAEAAGHYAGALEALELGAEATAAERLRVCSRSPRPRCGGESTPAGAASARPRPPHAPAATPRCWPAPRSASPSSTLPRDDHDAIAVLQGALDGAARPTTARPARVTGAARLRLDPATEQARGGRRCRRGGPMARRLGNPAALSPLWSPVWSTGGRSGRRRARRRPPRRSAWPGAAPTGAVWWARTMRLRDALEAAGREAVDAELSRLAAVRTEPPTYHRCARSAASPWATPPRLAEGERLAEAAAELNRRHGDDATRSTRVQRLVLARARRRPRGRAGGALSTTPPLPRPARVDGDAGQAEHRRTPRRGARRARRSPRTASPGSPHARRARGLALLAEPVAAAGGPGATRARLYGCCCRCGTPARSWTTAGRRPPPRPRAGALAAALGGRDQAGGDFAAPPVGRRRDGRRPRGSHRRSPTGCGGLEDPARAAPHLGVRPGAGLQLPRVAVSCEPRRGDSRAAARQRRGPPSRTVEHRLRRRPRIRARPPLLAPSSA